MPSGSTYKSTFNADNKVIRTVDSKGNKVTAEYDQSGLLQKIGNGKFWIKNTRDEAGRIIKVESSAGKTRQFGYDARGALTEYTNSKGVVTKFSYTEQGKLKSAVSSKGVIFKGDNPQKSKEVAFLKADYSAEPLQFDDFSQCGVFGDNFGSFSSTASVNDQTLDLSTSQMFCDPFAGMGSSFGVGGFLGSFSGNQECFDKLVCTTKIVACAGGIYTVVGGFIAAATCPTIIGCLIAVAGVTIGGAAIGLNCGAAIRICRSKRVCPSSNGNGLDFDDLLDDDWGYITDVYDIP